MERGLDQGTLIAVGSLVVAFLGLLLSTSKTNREAHAETEQRVRRDTILEQESKTTSATVNRIERAVNGLSGTLDGLSNEMRDIKEDVHCLQRDVSRHDKEIDEIRAIQRSDADIDLWEHEQNGRQQ